MASVAPSLRDTYKNLWIVLGLIIPLALLAFGPSFYYGLTFSKNTFTPLLYVHSAINMLWLVMLTGQAWLIRTERFRLHRLVGRSSFIIAPAVVVGTLITGHESATRPGVEITNDFARFFIYDFMQLIGFSLAWALGIAYRRKVAIHVRFMVSTVFAMGNAIVFRLILGWFSWVPGLGEENINAVAALNGAVLLIPLLALIAMDWRRGIKRSPFWLVTATTAIIHIGFFTFAKTDWWTSLVQRFAGLEM